MKMITTSLSLLALTLTLAACGSDEKTTIVHERPVVVQPVVNGADADDVEMNCAHGYDNRTHSCY